jgi:beta-phosphoglucomutase-like phosphatase (HAD superfamily)
MSSFGGTLNDREPDSFTGIPYHFVAEGLVADLDGTLIDTEPLYYSAYARVAAEFGKEYSFDIHQHLLGRAEHEGARNMIKELDLDDSTTAEDILRRRDVYFLQELPTVAPLPGALECMLMLKGRIPLAIATSSCREYLHLKRCNNEALFKYVDAIVCGDDAEVRGKSKPDPAIFLAGAKAINTRPEACVALEDSLAGMRSAKAAGMFVIAVPDSRLEMSDVIDVAPHLILRSLSELTPALLGLS